MVYEAIDYWNSDSLSHHGVRGMRWGIRHDPVSSGKAKIAKLNKKRDKLQVKRKKLKLKLDKKETQYDAFMKSRRGLIAKKAKIRQAKGIKNLGLLGRHYLTKSRKMEYKIGKLERRDYIYGKKINKIEKRVNNQKLKLNTKMAQTDILDFDDFKNEFLSHHGVKGMRWGIRHDPVRVSSGVKKAGKSLISKGKQILSKAFNVGKTAAKSGKKVYKNSRQKIKQNAQRRLDNNIAKAINNGDIQKVDKYFSKMNNYQVNNAIKRIQDRNTIRYALSQEKYRAAREYTDYLTAQNNYMEAKNRNYKLKHPYQERGRIAVENLTEKMLTRAATNYLEKKYPIFKGTGKVPNNNKPRLNKRR